MDDVLVWDGGERGETGLRGAMSRRTSQVATVRLVALARFVGIAYVQPSMARHRVAADGSDRRGDNGGQGVHALLLRVFTDNAVAGFYEQLWGRYPGATPYEILGAEMPAVL